MGQRMTIQYSVEESELKHEAKRLLSAALLRLTSINAMAPDSHNVLTISTLKEIVALREVLARIDIMLEDVSGIIDGYVRYEYDTFVAHSNEQEIEPPTDILPHLESLQEKVKNIRNNLQDSDEDTD